MTNFIPALRLLAWITLLTGVIYPLLVTGIGQLLFQSKTQGSLVQVNGKVVGSALIGQKFEGPKYFWSRPSAHEYDALSSGGTNYAPTSKALKNAINERQLALSTINGVSDYSKIPAELLFASGSGLDPHISPKGAQFQVDRIIKARNWSKDDKTNLLHLVELHTTHEFLGFIGEKSVNVLTLNIALDQMEKRKSAK